MYHDLEFRVILGLISVALYINHHVLHRKPSSRKAVKVRGVELMLLVTASLWTLALIMYVFGVNWFVVELPYWLRWTGVGLMLLCFPLSQWTYSELGRHFSKKLELQDDHQLIRSGPYRFVRHPMYSTLFLCAVATCFITAELVVMMTVVFVAVVFLLRIRREEAMLLARFGNLYREYQKQTAALVPGLI